MLLQLPGRVPWIQSRTWSMAALAALAAEDGRGGCVLAGPRFCAVGMNSIWSHFGSLIIGQTFLPPPSAWNTSGYCVAEWFPQMVTLRIELRGLPSFCAICPTARLWSRRIIAVNCVGFRLGAFFIAMRQLVLAGLPTTSTLTLRPATASSALPCGAKILPFASSRSLRSMPGPRGRAPTSSAISTSLNATIGSAVGTMPCKRGKAPSTSSIITPVNSLLPGLVSSLTRVGGALLFLALVWFLSLLDMSLSSEAGFARTRAYVGHPLVKLSLLALLWAYLHHFCAGIRYLLLDIDKGVGLPAARASSYADFAISLALTALLVMKLW